MKHDGTREDHRIEHDEAVELATAIAEDFGVKQGQIVGKFNADLAGRVLDLSEGDRKKLLRHGPVTEEAISSLGKTAAKSRARKSKSAETE